MDWSTLFEDDGDIDSDALLYTRASRIAKRMHPKRADRLTPRSISFDSERGNFSLDSRSASVGLVSASAKSSVARSASKLSLGSMVAGDDDGAFLEEEMDEGLGASAAYALTINYVLGVGALGIPYAFENGGIVLGCVCAVVSCALSFVTAMFIMETHSRAEELFPTPADRAAAHERIKMQSSAKVSSVTSRTLGDSPIIGKGDGRDAIWTWVYDGEQRREETMLPTKKTKEIERPLLAEAVKDKNGYDTPSSAHQERQRSSMEEGIQRQKAYAFMPKFEVAELCLLFLGKFGHKAYMISLCFLMYVGLVAYVNVFSSSMVAVLPFYECTNDGFFGFCGYQYVAYCFIMGIMVVPLSLMDLSEQMLVQAMLTLARFLSLGIMIVGPLVSLFLFSDDAGGAADASYASAGSFSDHIAKPVPLAKPAGAGAILSACVFGLLFQHSVPGLMHSVKPSARKSIKSVFGGALTTVTVIYVALGITCVLFFGVHIDPSANLNWDGFTWGQPSEKALTWWALALNYLVVVFPAVASISVYPLICVTLGNNLAFTYAHLGYSTRVWRLAASLLPLFIATPIRDLSLILSIAGIPGVWIAFVTPVWLYHSTMDDVDRRIVGPTPPEYLKHFRTPWLRKPAFRVAGIIFAVLTIIAVGFQLVLKVISMAKK